MVGDLRAAARGSSSTRSTTCRASAAPRPAAPSTPSPTSRAPAGRSRALQEELLSEAGVATISGTSFGDPWRGLSALLLRRLERGDRGGLRPHRPPPAAAERRDASASTLSSGCRRSCPSSPMVPVVSEARAMSGGALAARSVPGRLNLAYAVAVAGLDTVVLLGVPIALARGHEAAAWLIPAYVLATVPHWALVHEAVHGHFHGRRAGQRGGRPGAGDPVPGPVRRAALRPPVAPCAQRAAERAAGVLRPARAVGLARRAPPTISACCAASTCSRSRAGRWPCCPAPLLRPIVRWVFYDGAPGCRRTWPTGPSGCCWRRRRCGGMRIDALAILTLLAASFLLYGAAWPLLAGGSARPGVRRVGHGQRPALWRASSPTPTRATT